MADKQLGIQGYTDLGSDEFARKVDVVGILLDVDANSRLILADGMAAARDGGNI